MLHRSVQQMHGWFDEMYVLAVYWNRPISTYYWWTVIV